MGVGVGAGGGIDAGVRVLSGTDWVWFSSMRDERLKGLLWLGEIETEGAWLVLKKMSCWYPLVQCLPK